MAKLKVTVRHTQTATIEVGNMPPRLIKNLLEQNDGSFDGNYGLGDISRDDKWTVDEVTVEETAGGR